MLYTYEMLLDGRKFFENCDSLSFLALRFSLPSFICGEKKTGNRTQGVDIGRDLSFLCFYSRFATCLLYVSSILLLRFRSELKRKKEQGELIRLGV